MGKTFLIGGEDWQSSERYREVVVIEVIVPMLKSANKDRLVEETEGVT